MVHRRSTFYFILLTSIIQFLAPAGSKLLIHGSFRDFQSKNTNALRIQPGLFVAHSHTSTEPSNKKKKNKSLRKAESHGKKLKGFKNKDYMGKNTLPETLSLRGRSLRDLENKDKVRCDVCGRHNSLSPDLQQFILIENMKNTICKQVS